MQKKANTEIEIIFVSEIHTSCNVIFLYEMLSKRKYKNHLMPNHLNTCKYFTKLHLHLILIKKAATYSLLQFDAPAVEPEFS